MYGASDSNERLIIESRDLGSASKVAVNVMSGTLNVQDQYGSTCGYAYGSDMVATVNGLRATTNGNNISVNSPGLSMSATIANGVGSTGFTITGGGALLQLGPDVVSEQQMRIGINSMLSSALGGSDGSLFLLRSGQFAAINGTDEGRKMADRIVMDAISNVTQTRGQLGAIQKGSLGPNIYALQDSLVALTEGNAMITNADFAVESANMTRLQLLMQVGAQALGIANQLPQYAGSLVR
jgi:flagellin